MIFQILIVLFSLFAIFSIVVRNKKTHLTYRGAAFWVLFWLGVDLVILFPDSTTILANQLGIGRGTDLVVYVAIIAIFFLLFRLHVKIESINRDITKVVRRDAIEQAKKQK